MRDVRTILMTADTVGGVFTYATTLAAELAKDDVKVHLATLGEPLRSEQREVLCALPNVIVHESTFALEWMDDPWEDVAHSGEWLLELERAIAPDVVHLNGYAHGALPFAAPCVVVAHSCVLSWWEAVLGEKAPARYDRYREAVKEGLARTSAIVAISAAMRDALARYYDVRRCTVVPNGALRPRTRAFRKKAPFVLSCGRIWDPAKNVDALARIAPRLSWPTAIAGWQCDRAYANVCALGWLGQEDLGQLMERASIFALPARYEPFGLSPLEAALRGAALVLGDIPSLRDIWSDAALFVDPNNDDALAIAIEMLAQDASLRAELARRASSRALLYPASRTAKAMREVYASLRKGARACA